MQALRTFYHVLFHSLIPLDKYYRKVRKTKIQFTFKYFIPLIISVVTVSSLIKLTIFTTEYSPSELSSYIQQAAQDYPDELVMTINNNGRLTTNDDKPYIVFSPLANNPLPLLVVDPKAVPEKIFEYGSRFLLTERAVVTSVNDSIYEYPYARNNALTIDKTSVMLVAENADNLLENYWSVLFFLFMISIVLGTLFLSLSHLLFMIGLAFIAYISLKIITNRRSITYLNLLQIGLHSLTGPLIIAGIVAAFGLGVAIDNWYSLSIIAFYLGALYEAYFEK